MSTNNIEVAELARVEGEGGLFIGVKDGQVVEVRLDIYEPPRFFEGFLAGRFLQEVPDITARICGICPVAYQMSSVIALEAALDLPTSPEVRAMRRLFYCAEYIESHALHIYMLQAPDLLGHSSVLSLASTVPEIVQRALRLKKIGNELLRTIGGRSVHPVSACVGGFYRWPDTTNLRGLLPDLEWGLEAALETVRWAARLEYPELSVEYEFVALHHPDEYAILEGEVISSAGKTIPVDAFEAHYHEQHIKHSNALHSRTVAGQPYLVGPLARLNLNHRQLGKAAQDVMKETRLELPINNPYKSMIARAIELVQVYDEAIQLVKGYVPSGDSAAPLRLKAGSGSAATEAPRGLLYHKYSLDSAGTIETARIIPPTAQNLSRIEADLYQLAPSILERSHQQATLSCEHLVRSYDPCISCATHFLKLDVKEI